MQKPNILFVYNHEYFHLPEQLIPQIVKVWNIASSKFIKPKEHSFQLIMLYNGEQKFSSDAIQYMLQERSKGTPFLIFPYSSVDVLFSAELQVLHPLQKGTQCSSKDAQLQDKITIHEPHHAVVRHVKKVKCHMLSRDTSKAHPTSTVIASYSDGVPLIVERGLSMSLNFCLAHYERDKCDAGQLILNAVEYLIRKAQVRIFKRIPIAYADVKLI